MDSIATRKHIDFEPFTPKWWAFNVHVHTVLASMQHVEKPEFERVEIPTPDDDFLEADVTEGDPGKPVVALFHGLEGSTERPYICKLMQDLKADGYSSAALNFRGCGSRINRQRRFYHSGETEDYRTFFEWIPSRYPEKDIFAVGFSLGANALVKYLGEEQQQSKVKKAAAVSPPFDLLKGAINLHRGFNKAYEYSFLKTLVEKLEKKRKRYPDLPDFNGDSVYAFDDLVTAPVHGFRDAEDYYSQCSSNRFLEKVRTPLLIIHSREDTLCPLEYARLDKIEANPAIETIFTKSGGHVGFLSSPSNWLNRTILNWLDFNS